MVLCSPPPRVTSSRKSMKPGALILMWCNAAGLRKVSCSADGGMSASPSTVTVALGGSTSMLSAATSPDSGSDGWYTVRSPAFGPVIDKVCSKKPSLCSLTSALFPLASSSVTGDSDPESLPSTNTCAPGGSLSITTAPESPVSRRRTLLSPSAATTSWSSSLWPIIVERTAYERPASSPSTLSGATPRVRPSIYTVAPGGSVSIFSVADGARRT